MFEIEDISVEGDIGILGENRSGKSTILDLLQIILTGASSAYYRLNSPAGDNGGAKSKSQRTVRGYCLGQLGENDFKRESGLTYVSMSFVDPEGTRPPVTIGLALEASQNETTEIVLGRFVANGVVLTTADFLVERGGELYPIEWDAFRTGMVDRLGAHGFINHRDRALDFVREYMRRLVPGVSAGEKHASAMLKALVNAMTLPTGLSATQFVRNFIVPDQPIRIADLRNSIETYRGVDRAIAEMKARLAELKVIEEHVLAYRSAAMLEELEGMTAKRAKFLASLCRNREMRIEVAAAQERLKLRAEDVEDIDERISEIDAVVNDTVHRIAAKKIQSGLGDKERLATSFDARIKDLSDQLRRRIELAKKLDVVAKLPGLDPAMRTMASEYIRASASVSAGGRLDEMAAIEMQLMEMADGLTASLEDRRTSAQEEAAGARNRVLQLRATLGTDPSMRVVDGHLDPATRNLMQALRQDNMAPRPLCDIIEITDPDWTSAIEGLLGRDREAILVDRYDIARATALFKARRREFRGASLVSLNKIRDTGEMARPGHLPSLIRSEDRDAMLFVLRRYGNVRLAHDMAAFEADGRALMQDGLYDDGLARYHRAADPTDFKVGRSAQALLLQHRRAELADKEELAAVNAALSKLLDGAINALGELQQEGSRFTELMAALSQTIEEGKSNRAEIVSILARGDEGLSEKLRENLALKERTLEQKRALARDLAEDEASLRSNRQLLGGLQNVPGSITHLTLQKRFYAEHRRASRLPSRFGRPEYRERYRAWSMRHAGDHLPSHVHAELADAATSALERAKAERMEASDASRRALRRYFEAFGPSAILGAESALLTEVLPWLQSNIADIENNALREREQEAAEAAARARSLFRSEFINELTSRISNMDWELRTLNASMANHPFHNERYSFHKTQDAIYGPILRVIDIAKTSDEALDMLFADEIPEEFEFAETIGEVSRLLEDPDIDFSSFEDYRRFYTFDLHMEDLTNGRRERWEARRQTGSGAEQQVPLYVAIAASLASVYGNRPTSKTAGMALAMFDEAFTKLDGKNQRQMISFLKALGLQIVIVAPPEKRTVVTATSTRSSRSTGSRTRPPRR
jgi:energy-coupling factor transporter ATP-binding protein EcfA2